MCTQYIMSIGDTTCKPAKSKDSPAVVGSAGFIRRISVDKDKPGVEDRLNLNYLLSNFECHRRKR